MTPAEFRTLLALIWGRHGAQQAAARRFGVSDRSVRRWAAGKAPVPPAVADELRALAARAPLPVIPPPPGGTGASASACDEAIQLALAALIEAAQRAGWTRLDALAAISRESQRLLRRRQTR